jgi:peroxiredoxin family protein
MNRGRFPGRSGSIPNVRLACTGSTKIPTLGQLEAQGVELVLCQTCLDFFGLSEAVEVGEVGGMPDIIEALPQAGKVISL